MPPLSSPTGSMRKKKKPPPPPPGTSSANTSPVSFLCNEKNYFLLFCSFCSCLPLVVLWTSHENQGGRLFHPAWLALPLKKMLRMKSTGASRMLWPLRKATRASGKERRGLLQDFQFHREDRYQAKAAQAKTQSIDCSMYSTTHRHNLHTHNETLAQSHCLRTNTLTPLICKVKRMI